MFKEQNFTEENINDNKDADLELELLKLRTAYTDMKKERLRTEKDSKLLENKLKMLQTEEMKAYKTFSKEKKFKEVWEAARQRTSDFKNDVFQVNLK